MQLVAAFSLFNVYYWVGYDTWTHAAWNEILVNNGYLFSTMAKEASFPIQHIAVVVTDVLCNINIHDASLISVSLPTIILSITFFIIVKNLTNVQCGLIAMLVGGLLPPIISWVTLSQTTTYGYMLFTVLMLCYWKIKINNHYNRDLYFVVFLFVFITIIMTHAFSSFIILGIFIALYFGSIISEHKLFTFEAKLLFVLTSILLIYWIVTAWNANASVFEGILDTALYAFNFNDWGVSDTFQKYMNLVAPLPLNEFLDKVFLLFIVISALSLIFISLERRSKEKIPQIFVLLVASIGIIGFYLLSIFILPGMSDRFVPYCAFFALLAFSILLYYHICIAPVRISPSIYALITIVLISSLIFLFMGSSTVNLDNSIWVSETTISNGITIQECSGINTIIQNIPDIESCTYDHALSPVYGYYAYLHKYHESAVIPPALYHYPSYIDWSDINASSKNYLIFRSKLLADPTYQLFKYGTTSQRKFTQKLQLPSNFDQQLNGRYDIIYSNSKIDLYKLA